MNITERIVVAIIGALALIIAAVISGQYLLTSVKPPQTPIPATYTVTSTANMNTTSPTATLLPTRDFANQLQSMHLSQKWSDSMTDQSAEKWDNDNTYCTFQNGAYVVTHPVKQSQTCYVKYPQIQLNKIAFEAQMTITGGNSGGILFGENPGVQYYFTLDYNGYYTLYYHPHVNAPPFPCDKYCPAKPGIARTGYNQPNLLEIIVQGKQIYMYINGYMVYNVQGVNIPSVGTVGVLAISYDQATTSVVAFKNATLWA